MSAQLKPQNLQMVASTVNLPLSNPPRATSVPDSPTPIGRPPSQENWRIDKTLNLSTVMAILIAVIGVATFGVRANNDLEGRINKVTYDTEALRIEVKRIEGTLATQGITQTSQVTTLRTEIREDLKEINGKLDKLVMPQINQGRTGPTQGWTR